LKKTRIVLVDDDPHFIDLCKRALLAECVDIHLTTYSSGINFLEAIPLLTTFEQPHLILLDIRMPFMDGMQVAQAIRSHESYRITPILMLTSVDKSESIYQAYEQGANAYLVKPFSWPEIRVLAKHICTYWASLSPLPHRW
jgi:two-component system, response regulator